MTAPAPRWPIRLRRPVPVYAGDPCRALLRFRHSGQPVDVSSWGTWTAQARPTPESARSVDLTVDASGAASGEVYLVLDLETSTALRRAGAPWVFDAQTSVGPVTRVRGTLAAETDVTQ